MTVHDPSKGGYTGGSSGSRCDAMRCVTLVDDDDSDDDDSDDGDDGDGDGVSVFRRPRWIATTRRGSRSNQRRHAEDGVGYVSWEEEVETTTTKG